MDTPLKGFEAGQIFSTVLYVALGLLLVAAPGAVSIMMCYTVGICALVFGILKIIAYIRSRGTSFFKSDLIVGVLLTALGIFTLFKPDVILSILPIVLGIILILNGVTKFQRAFTLRRMGFLRWQLVLVLAVLSVGVGALFIWNPFKAAENLMLFLGICLILEGASDLWTLFCFSHLRKTLEHLERAASAGSPEKPFQESETGATGEEPPDPQKEVR